MLYDLKQECHIKYTSLPNPNLDKSGNYNYNCTLLCLSEYKTH